MSKVISTPNAPAAIGPYSQAIVSGSLVFTSGQIAITPATQRVETTTIEAQTEQVMKNLKAILEEAGSSMDRVIKTTCFLANIEDFSVFNGIYAQYLPGKPARSCVSVKDLPGKVLVEVEAIAEIG